jgi:hypothetical protein
MTTYFTDPFTGSNGSAWNASNWTVLFSATGSSAQIQSNTGQENAGTSSGPSNKHAMRYSGTNRADYEWSGKFTYTTSNNGSCEIWLRASTSSPDGTGYFLQLNTGGPAAVIKANSFTYTQLGSDIPSLTLAQNTEYGFKFYVVGTTIKAKVWPTSGSEPGSYQINVTDSAVAAAGYAYIATLNGSNSGVIFRFDDVTLTDGQGNAFIWTASVGASGAFSRGTVTKAPFTGSTTATGVLTTLKVVVKLFTGAVSTTGAFLKRTNKIFTASVSTVGVALKRHLRTFTASVTPTGFYRKASVRIFTASVSTVGTFSTTFLGRVFGRPGRAVVTVARAAETFIRVRRS